MEGCFQRFAKYLKIGVYNFLVLKRKHCSEELFNHILPYRQVVKERYIYIYTYLRKILDLTLKAFGLRIWITLHFTKYCLETLTAEIYNFNTFYWIWTGNILDSNL